MDKLGTGIKHGDVFMPLFYFGEFQCVCSLVKTVQRDFLTCDYFPKHVTCLLCCFTSLASP